MKLRKWTAITSGSLLLAMVGSIARTAPKESQGVPPNQESPTPVRIAPPPLDPYELVTSQPVTEETPEARAAVIALLRRALKQKQIFEKRYTVKVAFTTGGTVQEVGPGEMVETGTAANHRRWTGRVGSFSITRIIADRTYDSVPPGPIPIRLQMVREYVFGPDAPSTWGVIRTARATLDATFLTCILTSVHGSDAPGRDWPEIEYCVDPQSQLLRVFSAAPGIYVIYDYANSSESPSHPVQSQMTVVEAGQIVLQGSINAKPASREELEPSLFTPTSGMYTGGVGLIWPTYQTQSRGRGAVSGLLQPVIVHATLAPDGSVVEAESLQTSNQALSQSALEVVRKTKYHTTFNYGYSEQQEIFVTVE